MVMSALGCRASWYVAADADLRYGLEEWRRHHAEVHVAGVSARKTFADAGGDRLILFGLAEAEDNFSMLGVHEAYGRLKGPMGVWNVTLGRFTLPYGLLGGFSTSRLLYSTAYQLVIGFDADNGIMVSGTNGMLDYALSVTQGFGAHHLPALSAHGLALARIGLTMGEGEEIQAGVSGLFGNTSHSHDRDMKSRRFGGGADITAYIARALLRMEVNAGMVDGKPLGAVFAGLDVALTARLDLNCAMTVSRLGRENSDAWFLGMTFKPKWLTIRGGYRYAYFSLPRHTVTLQAYRLFSFSF